jgi:rod shape-determining protein MreC
MESFLNRYRNITVLLLVIFAQLVLLAVQVKNDQDVRFIRVWSVTAVSPFARLVEGLRGSSISFIHNYITLHDADAQNRRLQAEVDRLKLDNIFLTNELNTADRAQALQLFQQRTPSKTLAASVFSMGIGSSRKVVYVDRGSVAGVMREMAVVIPDGIVGKVTAVYPMASEVLLITDPTFAAGVVSAKGHVHGTLKGTGMPLCKVDFVAFEDKVEPGDWFYTSGDDRIFPRGMPVGVVKSVRPGQPYKEITLDPSGMAHGSPEDVLIVVEGVHQEIPDTPPANQQVYLAPPPPLAPAAGATAGAAADGTAQPDGSVSPAGVRPPAGTEADKTRALYQKAAEGAGIVLGGGPTGQVRTDRPPDFTKLVDPRTAIAGRGTPPAPMPVPVPVPKKGTGPPAVTKGTRPAELKAPPDAVRRANQAAGGGPGGIPQP